MAATSFLVIFFLSHFALLFSAKVGDAYPQPPCPPFQCGNISFPFSSTTVPKCGGLCEVDCLTKTIKLGNESPGYKLDPIIQADIISIHDQVLEHNLCNASKTLSLLNSPFISFSFIENTTTTFFNCNPPSEPTYEEYFSRYHSYKECPDYSLFYSYPEHCVNQTDSTLPQGCSLVQLLKKPHNWGLNSSDPFQLVAFTFDLSLQVSVNCSNCRNKGGTCETDESEKFHCANLKQDGSKTTVILASATSGGVVIIICIIVLIIVRRKLRMGKYAQWGKKTESCYKIENFLKINGLVVPKRYCYSDIKKMTRSFKDKLGQGGYGYVYKGKLDNGSLVAVKVLKESKGNGEEFVNEVASISRTSHVNVVTLLGFCFEGQKRALIYEFMPNGSLEKFVSNGIFSVNSQLGWDKSYRIAIGIARGLEYLHRGCNTRILHFDIKPHNILLDEDFIPKISDFGLAKLCPGKESVISMLYARGTIGYIAPEVFCRNFGRVSHKSDVYSYGMMVLEIVGGRNNIKVEDGHTSEIYFPDWIYKKLESDKELRMYGMNEDENVYARKMIIVSLWCIQSNPSTRPSMSSVVGMLEGSLESLKIPLEPVLSYPPVSPAHSSAIEIS